MVINKYAHMATTVAQRWRALQHPCGRDIERHWSLFVKPTECLAGSVLRGLIDHRSSFQRTLHTEGPGTTTTRHA